MSFGNTLENDLLKLLLNGTAIAGIADNAAAGALTTFYLSLHTADPGEAGTQTTNETAYTGYARQAVARTPAGWTVTNNVAALASNVEFPVGTGAQSEGSVTHFAIGTAANGAGKIIASGQIVSPQDQVTPMAIDVGLGIIPRLNAGTNLTLD